MLDFLLIIAAGLLLFRFSADKAKAMLASIVLSAFFLLLLAYIWSIYMRFPNQLGLLDAVTVITIAAVVLRLVSIAKRKRANVENALAVVYGFSSAAELYENADEVTKLAFSAACADDPRLALEAAGLDVSWIEEGGDPHLALKEAQKIRAAELDLAAGWHPHEPA